MLKAAKAAPLPALVVFSHLRWGSMRQRHQQLMSRLASRWRIWFIEEPVRIEGEPVRLDTHDALPNLQIVVPRTAAQASGFAPGFNDAQYTAVSALLSAHMRRERVRKPVAWLTTPMAQPLVKTIKPRGVVYDCIDDLAAFADAPPQLAARESELLHGAALVLAGGPTMHEAKRAVHPNVHCVQSAVDAAHFAVAPPERARPDALVTLGHHGPIDERIDFALLAALADARPGWRIVMAGPVAACVAPLLPHRDNILWLDEQRYEALPRLIAGWDVCLLPYARNEAARTTYPSQVLEYMAADKPVVGTSLPDLRLLHSDVVKLSTHDPLEFAQACEDMLAEPAAVRCHRAMDMLHAVSACSWDHSAESIHRLIDAALNQAPVPLMARVLPTARLKKLVPRRLPSLSPSGVF